MSKLKRWAAAGVLFAGVVGGAAFGGSKPDADPTPAAPPAPYEEWKATEPAGLPLAVRSDAAVTLKWAGPAEAKVNRPAGYTLTVANACGQPLSKVVVQVRVPAEATASDVEPPARAVGGVLLWEVGTLDARETKDVRLSLASPARGALACQAWVTFTGSASMSVAVREPKLAVKLTLPESVAVDDGFQVKYEVSNPGDAPADKVSVAVSEPTGFIPASEPPAGVELNDLSPAGTRTVTRERKAVAPGEYTYAVTASSPDGVTATATAKVRVKAPKLVAAIAGPAEVGLNKAAAYTVKVTNVGDLVAEGVDVRAGLGTGLRTPDAIVQTSFPAITHDPCSRAFAGLQPGETQEFTVTTTAVKPGDAISTVIATGKRGLRAAAECRTVVQGVPGIRMEVIDVADPVETGKDAVYEIRVSNTGTQTDTNLKVVCTLPPQLKFLDAAGPVGVEAAGDRVVFEPIRELGPRAEVVLKVRAKAVAAGNTRFRASLTSGHLTDPVLKEESTTIYGE